MLNRLSLIAVVFALTAITAPSALAASGPVGVWKLDEGSGTIVTDTSGNGNNGVLLGGVTWVPGVFGGSGLSFDGSTGEVKAVDNDALEPPTSVTVSAWFRNDSSPGEFRYVVAKGANGCIAASYGLYSGPGGGLEFYVSKGHGSTFARSPDAGQGVWDGSWHLAVGTYDGTTIRLYVDGVQVGSGTAWAGSLEYLLPNSNDFYIGNYPGCSDHEFLGDIDNVTVWGRALGGSDIQGLLTVPGGSQGGSPTGGGQGGNGGGTSTGGGGTSTGGGGTSTGGGGTSTGGGGTASPKGKDALAVHRLTLSSTTVTVNASGHVVSVGSSPGLSITYTESNAARLTVTLLHSEAGVRRGKRCVKPSGRARNAARCSRFVVITSFMRTDPPGRRTLALKELLHRRLAPGTYRLDVTPRAQGKVGKTVSVRFVVRRSPTHR